MPLCRVEPVHTTVESEYNVVIEGWSINGLLLGVNRIETGGSRLLRGRQERGRMEGDPLQLFLFRRGGIFGRTGGQDLHVRPGDVGLIDLGRDVRLEHPGSSEHLTVIIPRDRLLHRLVKPRLPEAMVLPRERVVTQLLAHHIEAVVHALPDAMAEEGEAIADGLLDLLAATFNPAIRQEKCALDRIALSAIRDFIEYRLDAPSLSAQMICARFRCSRAYLYRLFKPYGGVQHYIRERRLLRSYRQLSSPRQAPQTVMTVAMQNGFTNQSHFSRLFREQFGITPSQLREQRIELYPHQEWSRDNGASIVPDFYHWFCKLF